MKMKKILTLLLVALLSLGLVACSNSSDSINAMSLDDIMDKLYEGIPEEDLPMLSEHVAVTADNENWYLGTSGLEFEEAIASEALIGSIAHSVVLVRVDEKDVEAVMNTIKDSINTYKWVCVGIEKDELVIENRGNVILVVVDALGLSDKIVENFENIK